MQKESDLSDQIVEGRRVFKLWGRAHKFCAQEINVAAILDAILIQWMSKNFGSVCNFICGVYVKYACARAMSALWALYERYSQYAVNLLELLES